MIALTCRFAMLVGRDPKDPNQLVLAQVRNTLARVQPSLSYRIVGSDKTTARVEWLGPNPHSANELLAGKARQENNPRDQAVAFLEQFLAAGPRTSDEIWQAAVKAGLSKRTLERAKCGMDIRCRRVQVDGRPVSYWLMGEQELPAEFASERALDRIIQDLEKRYPRNPLDDEQVEDGRERAE